MSGLSTAALLALWLASGTSALRVKVGGLLVDYSSATITVEAGAAADLRLPSPDLARPSAERRAQAAVMVKLRAGLAALSLGRGRKLDAGDVDRAASRARTVDVEYQSNGGVIVRLELRFAHLLGTATPPAPAEKGAALAVAVSAMPLEVAPVLVVNGAPVGGVEVRYRIGSPPEPARAVRGRRDGQGRLLLEGGDTRPEQLARSGAMIYVARILGEDTR